MNDRTMRSLTNLIPALVGLAMRQCRTAKA